MRYRLTAANRTSRIKVEVFKGEMADDETLHDDLSGDEEYDARVSI